MFSSLVTNKKVPCKSKILVQSNHISGSTERMSLEESDRRYLGGKCTQQYTSIYSGFLSLRNCTTKSNHTYKIRETRLDINLELLTNKGKCAFYAHQAHI
eukprot:CFRG0720T1